MKVDNLKTLAKKLVEHADKQHTDNQYEEFYNILAHTLHGNRREAVSSYRDKLFANLRAFDSLGLTYSESNLFDVLHYGETVGESAVKAIDAILHDEHFDPAGVVQQIEKKRNAFKQFLERNRHILAALDRVPTLQESSLKSGEALLEITFTDHAAVDNIVDFEEWIDCWTKIIRAFGRLTGDKPETARVVFVQKSSPLVIDIAAVSGMVIIIGKAVDSVLGHVDKYLSIRKQAEEIKKLKLENKQIEKALEAEADAYSDKAADDITKQLTSHSKPKPDGEVANSITLAVKQLFVFIDKGGRVDCPSAPASTQQDVNTVFNHVRQLQKSVDGLRLLSAKTSDNKHK